MTLHRKSSVSHRQGRAGYTVIEMLELMVAMALARWLAATLSRPLEGIWHAVVFWSVMVVGTVIVFLCFLYGLGHLFECLDRRRNRAAPHDEGKSDAP